MTTTRLLTSVFFCLLAAGASARAQQAAANLLRDPEALEGAKHWRAHGRAAVEGSNGERAFVLRGGHFFQDVALPEGAQGLYVLFVADATCEGCRAETITGRPYLYGYMTNTGPPERGRIYAYLQDETMRADAAGRSRVWGVFKVPAGASRVRFFLQQGLQNGVPYHGEVARFTRPALYLVTTQEQARLFARGEDAPDTAAAGSPAPPPQSCEAGRLRGVAFGGIRLGMNPEEVKAVFGGDAGARAAFGGRPEPDEFGDSHLTVGVRAQAFGEPPVKGYLIRFLDGRAYHVSADYADGTWNHRDALVSAVSESLSLPGLRAWETAGMRAGNYPKYLMCGRDEIRLHAAPSRGGGRASGLLVDHAAEKVLAGRRTAREAAAAR